jgi:hypothetical protein
MVLAKFCAVVQATNMKIVHLPTDLGMRAYSLSRAEQELGLDSWMIVKRIGVHNSNSVQPLLSNNLLGAIFHLLTAWSTSLKADVVMANNASTLLDFSRMNWDLLDLPIYKIIKKRIIVTYQGCDIRLCETCPIRSSLPSQETCTNVPTNLNYQKFDDWKLKRFKIWSKYAYAILGITPDLCRVQGVNYTPHAKLIKDSNYSQHFPHTKNDVKIKIAHMPKQHIKGSEWIEPTLKKMADRFYKKVDYLSISGLSWQESLETLANCDILIDQVLSGWYGGISVEAALLGVLPIAYIDSDLLRFVPENMQDNLPVLALRDKKELPSVLEKLISDRDYLTQEALRCHKSALKFHDAKVVAKQLISQYYQDVPRPSD